MVNTKKLILAHYSKKQREREKPSKWQNKNNNKKPTVTTGKQNTDLTSEKSINENTME